MITQHGKRAILVVLTTILALSLATPTILSRAGGEYDLSWWTTAGGGGASSGGGYGLRDTQGQAVSANLSSFGGQRYSLTDGFWSAGSTERAVYLPMVVGGGSRL